MRYLVLAAEYTQSALRDEYVGHVTPEEIGLSWELATGFGTGTSAAFFDREPEAVELFERERALILKEDGDG